MPANGQTMQIGDHYLNDGHLAPEIPRIDGHHAVHHTRITPASIPCHNVAYDTWPSRCSSKFPMPPAGQPFTSPTATAVRLVRCGWSSAAPGSDLTLMSLHAAYYFFLQHQYRRFADADSPMFRHAPMLPIFDVRCVHRLGM